MAMTFSSPVKTIDLRDIGLNQRLPVVLGWLRSLRDFEAIELVGGGEARQFSEQLQALGEDRKSVV